jgi:hypothetical protein
LRDRLQHSLANLAKPIPDGAPRDSAPPSHPALQPSPVSHFLRDGESLTAQFTIEPAGTARAAHVAFPIRASSPVRIEDAASGLWITSALVDAASTAAEPADGFIAYRGAFHGADIIHRPMVEGTEDYVWFEKAPSAAAVTYEVALGDRVAGLRLVGDVLEFLDAAGDPRLRIAPPYVIDSQGARHEVALSVRGCAVDESPLPPWGRPLTAPGSPHCSVLLKWQLPETAYPALLDPAWVTTGAMAAARGEHRATRLASGLVLVTGGAINGANPLSGCELYNPGTGTWAATGSMKQPRYGHTLTTLLDGRIFVAGGGSNGGGFMGGGAGMGTGEIYNPANGQWSYAAGGNRMNRSRIYHAAALQPSTGRVLITGGYTGSFISRHSEAYFPNLDAWVDLYDENTPRMKHNAAFVNGRPIIFGGSDGVTNLNSVEYLDIANAVWRYEGAMGAARATFAFVQQGDGSVVVAGGDSSGGQTNTFEVMSATSFAWGTLGGMASGRAAPSLNEFSTGMFLAAGGSAGGTALGSSESWSPATNSWTFAATLNVARASHTGTVIGDGTVLVAGGNSGGATTSSAEILRIPQSCTSNASCMSGNCVDGYCCNTACNGACDQCNLPNQQGLCLPAPAGSAGAPSCSPYSCNGASASCPTSCAADTDCIGGDFCSAGVCMLKTVNGGACNGAIECKSGFCSDGVCCNSACDNACDVCNASLGASSDGSCTLVSSGNPGNPACSPYLCSGISAACPSSCAADTQCASGDACVGGKCVAKVNQGGACVADNQCFTTHCSDGFCCDFACDGSCDACAASLGASQNGSCTVVAKGGAGVAPSCAPYLCDGNSASCPTGCVDDTNCDAADYCDGSKHCVTKLGEGGVCGRTRMCRSGFCADGFCCNSACDASCDVCSASLGATANGTCSPARLGSAGAPACGVFRCDGTHSTCPSQCASDAVCGPSTYCNGVTCVAPLPTGSACTASRQCSSGACVDGFCCNSACNGACDVCAQALGAASDGMCTPSAQGSTGSPSCAPFLCDGAQGTCPTTCLSATDCSTRGYCAADGTCQPKQAPGGACNGPDACLSGFCVDGFCCNSACNDACDACNAPGNVGTCSPVAAGVAGKTSCGAYLCDGSAISCPTTCEANAGCVAADYCDANSHCVPRLTNGNACTDVGQCASGNCVDGFCCNAACNDGCDVCAKLLGASADGTCTSAIGGTAGNPLCTPYLCDGSSNVCPTTCTSDAACVAGDFCNASHRCVPKAINGGTCSGTNQCTSGFCVGGTCCNTGCGGSCEVCARSQGASVDGTCTSAPSGAAGSPQCAPYLCDGSRNFCPATCASDSNCVAGDYCDSTQHCVVKTPNGGTCSAVNQCASGNCVDGFCCNTACAEGCDVCAKSLGASADGACTPSPAGTPGAPLCTPYLCDGAQKACPPACASDASCVAGDFCNGSHQCVPKQTIGSSCTGTDQCSSGFCADGVCCNTACTDQCAACNTAAQPGICGPAAPGSPVGLRAACATDATLCGGQCDGATTACAYPGQASLCGMQSCQGNDNLPAPTCNGLGACQPSAAVHCVPYVCGAGGCLTQCGADLDCTAGNFCGNGVCQPLRTPGATCGRAGECTTAECASGLCCDTACQGACSQCDAPGHQGTCTPLAAHATPANGDCAPLLCDGVSESCPLLCASSAECAAGYVCLSGRCEPAKPQGDACSAASDCGSGFCIDGVCCDGACEGSCASCALPDHVGACTLTSGAAAPGRQACKTEGVCGGSCDGQHPACGYAATGSECGPGYCAEATANAASLCDGAGQCVPGAQTACIEGCAGDRCTKTARVARGGCASSEPASLGLLVGFALLGLRRRRRDLR